METYGKFRVIWLSGKIAILDKHSYFWENHCGKLSSKYRAGSGNIGYSLKGIQGSRTVLDSPTLNSTD